MKLMRKLRGKDVQITHGLAQSLAEIDALPDDVRGPFCKELAEFLDGLVSHYVLDDGKLVVAHAGMKAEMQGRGSGKVREFALYGETTGETDEFGLPVRYNWAAEYRGSAMVVYGHTPVPEPEWLNRTVNIDTGCVFGGKLTALRYPEKEFVSVPAARTYCEPARPFLAADQQAPKLTAQQIHDEVLDAEDVLGKRIVSTRLRGNVTIREANATAALEVMSRFAANPKWLIYLPPTMSPCETSSEPGLLEHPAEAFAYYRSQGAPQVICEEKHMGSRAVVIVCQDEQAARERFGVVEGEIGIVYTRTGQAVLQRAGIGSAVPRPGALGSDRCRLLERTGHEVGLPRLRTDAVVGQGTGTSARPSTQRSGPQAGLRCRGRSPRWSKPLRDLAASDRSKLEAGRWRVPTPGGECRQVRRRLSAVLLVGGVVDRPEAGPVSPAGHGRARPHGQEPHLAHGDAGQGLPGRPGTVAGDSLQDRGRDRPGQRSRGDRLVDRANGSGRRGHGGQAARLHPPGQAGLAQPAVKCRGREYLRIIYGPDYTADENISLGCETAAWATSGHSPSANSPSASRGWSGSSAGSRCAGCMSASSASWPWRASRWIRGFDFYGTNKNGHLRSMCKWPLAAFIEVVRKNRPLRIRRLVLLTGLDEVFIEFVQSFIVTLQSRDSIVQKSC